MQNKPDPFSLLIATKEKQDIKVVPHNILIEQMLLGSLLTNNNYLGLVNDFLRPEHFYEPIHAQIYETILLYNNKGLSANIVTLKNHFDKNELLSKYNAKDYLVSLASFGATIINVKEYGEIICDLAIRRHLIIISSEITNDAYGMEIECSADKQIELAEQKLFNLSSKSHNINQELGRSSLSGTIKNIELAFKNKGKVNGISTGYKDLDKILGGFQNSDLVILAARPAMGKTALAINLAMNTAATLRENHLKEFPDDIRNIPKAGIFSLEMSSDQLNARMISIKAGIKTTDMRSGNIGDDEFRKIFLATKKLEQLDILANDMPALTIASIRTKARRAKKKHNLAILFIDYLQLLKGTTKISESNKVHEITEITQGLKAIAKELDIPIIALSQLSRAVETRIDKRPLLSDLRESGSIEQDADIVMFIYREEYYLSKPQEDKQDDITKWQSKMENVHGKAEIIIAKHRSGATGNVNLHFEATLTKFSNLDDENKFSPIGK
jgi:replicative DNA helicase